MKPLVNNTKQPLDQIEPGYSYKVVVSVKSIPTLSRA